MHPRESFRQYFEGRLNEREQAGLLRRLVIPSGEIDFCSNDYLGFSRLPELNRNELNLPSGSTGSRNISGNSMLAEEAERCIADFHGHESALIFQSGYAANLGLFSSIAGRGDTVICDEYIHASVIDGVRMSHAQRLKFRHNDPFDLARKIASSSGRVIVAVESVYSMHGDVSPLKEIAEVCRSGNAALVVDEAHATGVFGSMGEGWVSALGLQDEVLAVMYTFGKALGLHGGAVAGSSELRNYMINFARSFIYTTAPPPLIYSQLQEVYRMLPGADRNVLMSRIDFFRKRSTDLHAIHFADSPSPIQSIIMGDNDSARQLADYLLSQGIHCRAILSPTVPEGQERLRICLHVFNTEEEIDHLIREIKSFLS